MAVGVGGQRPGGILATDLDGGCDGAVTVASRHGAGETGSSSGSGALGSHATHSGSSGRNAPQTGLSASRPMPSPQAAHSLNDWAERERFTALRGWPTAEDGIKYLAAAAAAEVPAEGPKDRPEGPVCIKKASWSHT